MVCNTTKSRLGCRFWTYKPSVRLVWSATFRNFVILPRCLLINHLFDWYGVQHSVLSRLVPFFRRQTRKVRRFSLIKTLRTQQYQRLEIFRQNEPISLMPIFSHHPLVYQTFQFLHTLPSPRKECDKRTSKIRNTSTTT